MHQGEKTFVCYAKQEFYINNHFADFDNFKRVYIDDSNNVCWDKNPEIDSETIWNNKVDLSGDVCYMESVPIVVSN
ncbi:MAG: hypothetical protein IJJ71_10660 [Treponema sp.]|uniref:hypothetical protein n=1 Tax=Treponema sp. TaxID=166 RepID=UPI002600E8DB|nr:hypothetical protein [Treponema sp.]MBR0099738.1 hypothetical protein [Treponema sp.]MBR0496622.1 hypothetical protein [Treponema sp.]